MNFRRLCILWFIVGLILYGNAVSRELTRRDLSFLPRLQMQGLRLTRASSFSQYFYKMSRVAKVSIGRRTYRLPVHLGWVPLAAWTGPVSLWLLLEVLGLVRLLWPGRLWRERRLRDIRRLALKQQWAKVIEHVKAFEKHHSGDLSEGSFLKMKLIEAQAQGQLGQHEKALAAYRQVLNLRSGNPDAQDGAVQTILARGGDVPHDWLDTYSEVIRTQTGVDKGMVRQYASTQLKMVGLDREGIKSCLRVFEEFRKRPDVVGELRHALADCSTKRTHALKALLVLGQELVLAGQDEKAREHLREALLVGSDQDITHQVVSECFRQSSNLSTLATVYEELLPRLKSSPALTRALKQLKGTLGVDL